MSDLDSLRRLYGERAMTPDANARRAYARGYEAALTGDGRNPYERFGRRLGVALSAWWSAGHSDGRDGRKQRYDGGGEP